MNIEKLIAYHLVNNECALLASREITKRIVFEILKLTLS